METAPPVTREERARLIEKCPELQRGLFTDWLDGKRNLAGDLLIPEEVTAQ